MAIIDDTSTSEDENSTVSTIELDIEVSDGDHTNQVYCRCSLCAERGYGSAWVSRNTRSRHMKAEHMQQIHQPQYSESSSSELTSDEYSGTEMVENYSKYV